MQLLTQQETPILLSLLLSSEAKSLRTVQTEFERAFPDRFRACCAVVLLLEDPTVLRLPQRIASWFLLSIRDAGANSASPFLPLLDKAASNPAAPHVERTFLRQLLLGPLPAELAEVTPRALAFSAVQLPAATAAAAGAAAAPTQPQRDQQQQQPGATTAALPTASSAGPKCQTREGSSGAPDAAPRPQGHALQHAVPAAAAAQGQQQQHQQPVLPAALMVWERPQPAVLTPLPSELKWLNPDLQGELLWDSDMGDTAGGGGSGGVGVAGVSGSAAGGAGGAASARLDGAGSLPGSGLGIQQQPGLQQQQQQPQPSAQGAGGQQAARDLLASALRAPLLPMQQQQLLAEFDADPRVILRLGLTPAHLPALVENAPVVATEALMLLIVRWPERAAGFLGVLARSEMSLHSLEVVNRLTSTGAVPVEFVHLYITNCIHSCESTQDKYVQNRLVRLVCVFLQSLIRNKVIHIHELLHEVQAFCINFSRIREAAKLFRLLKQIEAAMRGADGAAAGAGGAGEEPSTAAAGGAGAAEGAGGMVGSLEVAGGNE
ncbi:hypothetical protein Agub_g3452 [Astrephomene gubernaculifera]|uniref:CCR4-NOT transcription complex subunit 11 n=1 Tax=Astrephomene gubernaculifera TaxID=47775 RepID=A0AAD3HJD8_9CHLO|nr:hypothetical protein Agub_g3452 [Astrephomene gubernaculifera]